MEITDLTPKMVAFLRVLEKGDTTKRKQEIYSLPSIQMVSWLLVRYGLIKVLRNNGKECIYHLEPKGKRVLDIIGEIEEICD